MVNDLELGLHSPERPLRPARCGPIPIGGRQADRLRSREVNHFRQITSETDRSVAARQVVVWGYPRTILTQEVKVGVWFSYGDVALIWYLAGPIEGSKQVHVCADPKRRMVLGTPENMLKVGFIAKLMGAERLYSVIPKGYEVGLPARAMARYLRMRGWKQDEWGSYVDLGGD